MKFFPLMAAAGISLLFNPSATAAVTLGNWTSPTGLPTTSAVPYYPFITAHDEGENSGTIAPISLPDGTGFFFSITNNHPTADVMIDQISVTASSPNSSSFYSVYLGYAPFPVEFNDALIADPAQPYITTAAEIAFVAQPVGPGETFFVIPHSTFDGGSIQINNVTIMGTAIPEPSATLLAVIAVSGLVARRRRA